MTTTSYLLPSEWRALLRNYLIGFAIAAIALFIGGMRCAGYLSHRPDPAIALEAKRSAAYHDSLLAERGFNASLAAAAVVAEARLDSAQRKAVVTGGVADSLTRGITIDTRARTARDPGSRPAAGAADTTAWAIVQRASDTTHYLIPKFIGDGFLALQAHAAALQDDVDAEHAARLIADARFLDDSTHRVTEQRFADSLNASLTRQVDALQRQGHPWCAAKCGATLTLVALTAAAITLREVRR